MGVITHTDEIIGLKELIEKEVEKGSIIPQPTVSDAGKALRYSQTGPNTYNVGWYPVREYPVSGSSGQVLVRTGSGLNDVAWQTLIPSGSAGQVLARYGAGANEVYFADIKQVPTPNAEYDYGKVLKTDGTTYFWDELPQPAPEKIYHLRRVRCDLADITKNISFSSQTLYSCVIDEIEDNNSEWVDFNSFTDETIKGLAFNNFNHFDIYNADGELTSLYTEPSSIYIGTKIAEQNIMSALYESNGAFIINSVPFEFSNQGTILYNTSIKINGYANGSGIQWYTNNSNIYKKDATNPSGIVETVNDPYTTGNIRNIACKLYEEDTVNDKALFYVITQDN